LITEKGARARRFGPGAHSADVDHSVRAYRSLLRVATRGLKPVIGMEQRWGRFRLPEDDHEGCGLGLGPGGAWVLPPCRRGDRRGAAAPRARRGSGSEAEGLCGKSTSLLPPRRA